MGKLISTRLLTVPDIMSIDRALTDELLKIASTRLAIPAADLHIRPILPKEDLGLTNNEWIFSLATANAWNTAISAKLLDRDCFLGIYGVSILSATPLSSAVKFSRGVAAGIVECWEYEDMQVQDEPTAVTPEPIIYPGDTRITLDIWCRGTTGSERLTLLGAVAEPRGKHVAT